MAQFRTFADLADGTIVEIPNARHDGSSSTKAKHFYGTVGGIVLHATRRIEMKARPTRHECDARCLNAIGLVMRCECACGGKNHGRGSFTCN